MKIKHWTVAEVRTSINDGHVMWVDIKHRDISVTVWADGSVSMITNGSEDIASVDAVEEMIRLREKVLRGIGSKKIKQG